MLVGVLAEAVRLGKELAGLCAALDPEDVPLGQASALWSAFDGIERLGAGAKCRLSRRVEESRAWQAAGTRSAAEWMAARSGTTTGRARDSLETSKALAGLPEADQALANGELSHQQASAIAGAGAADPSAERRLLELARRADLRRLREACARTRARAEDDAERADRLHRQRCLRTWTGPDGSWNLSVRNTPEVGAELEAALAPLREMIFNSARLEGRVEPGEAYGADALAEMVRRSVAAGDDARPQDGAGGPEGAGPDGGGPEGGGPARRPARSRRPDTKVIALISHEALKRGWAEADETCEIAGVGPVPVATVRSLLGDAFGAAIVTDGVDVFTVAHLGRSASAHQRSALEARGYCCEVPGCGSTTALEIDHIDDWHLSFRTRLDQLCWLCRRHHLDKTHRGARLRGPPGNRRWVPPGAEPARAEPPGPEPPAAAPAAVADEGAPSLFDELATV